VKLFFSAFFLVSAVNDDLFWHPAAAVQSHCQMILAALLIRMLSELFRLVLVVPCSHLRAMTSL
jgi:hypothetical protein